MAEIPVQPVESEESTNYFSVECTIRVKILDVVNGKPVTDAYAVKPARDGAVLDRRGKHPFRVLQKRSTTFTGTGIADFSFDSLDLKTFELGSGSTDASKQLKASWKVAGEFVHPATDGAIVSNADGSTVFAKIHADDERYICIKSGNTIYAQRDLITNRDGVLEIPVSFSDWFWGEPITIKLRDHYVLIAEGAFDPAALMERAKKAKREPGENGVKELSARLDDAPLDNNWFGVSGKAEKKFVEEIKLDPPAVSRNAIDFTLWAVRKVRNSTELVPNGVPGQANGSYGQRGIMIHYNSGYYMSEKRGTTTRLCREAFVDHENEYMMRPEMAIWILIRIGINSLGYHYHMARDGTILISRPDDTKVSHAGHSREPTTVTARENVGDNPRTVAHTFTNPRSNLNAHYIGIDLLGYHEVNYGYTTAQHWYLDRLIENIRSRATDIEWYHILGHDEVRTAYNATQSAANQQPAKLDPGAALNGGAQGMELLRGRHGAEFPSP